MSITARLVAVCHSEDYPFERRQIPLVVDDNLTMVVQFNDSCVGCDQVGIKPKELERFVHKYRALSSDEVAVALMVTNKEIISLLSQMVPCVGCRRSVERLFAQLVKCGYPALEPLIITSGSILSIKREYLFDPKAIYALFYVHGSKLTDVMESIPKSKKNKRCALHSLDSHKQKILGSWMDIWDVLSQDCRDEVVLIECDTLMETLENYLRKHRFCSECKSKVLRAYNILTGEVDSALEKGYCPQLYDGLRCCPGERHIHVKCETDFIAHLIGRAEPELTGSRRERHAKTLDIAQEEVLTCLGIHLYERLHKIWQKLRAEEQTWQLLFFLGVDALRKNFEVALEKKQGISNLELMCEELLQEEKALELKREHRRQKRKKKKNKNKPDPEIENDIEKENCSCDGSVLVKQSPVVLGCENCDDNHNLTRVSSNSRSLRPCQGDPANKVNLGSHGDRGQHGKNPDPPGDHCIQAQNPNPPGVHHHGDCADKENNSNHSRCTGDVGSCTGPLGSCADSVISSRSDCGYSSGHEGCESCSLPSSNDGSDIACTEGLCNHDGDSPMCARSDLGDLCRDCLDTGSSGHSPKQKHRVQKCNVGKYHSSDSGSSNSCYHRNHGANGGKFGPMTLSLQDMLEASCSSGEEEDAISEEEIQKFKANQKLLTSQRAELRAKLKMRFANMQQRQECVGHPPGSREPEVVNSTSTVGGVEVAKAKVTKVKDVTSRVTKLSMN